MTNSTFSIHRVDCWIFQWKGLALGMILKFLVLDLMWLMIVAGSKRSVVYLQTVNSKVFFKHPVTTSGFIQTHNDCYVEQSGGSGRINYCRK